MINYSKTYCAFVILIYYMYYILYILNSCGLDFASEFQEINEDVSKNRDNVAVLIF